MRARWALIKTGHLVMLREVDLRNKPIELIKVSSKSTVPVLCTENNIVIDESIEIIKWSLRISDPLDILRNKSESEKVEIQTLLDENDHIFKRHLDRYKYSSRYSGEDVYYHQESSRKILYNWNL